MICGIMYPLVHRLLFVQKMQSPPPMLKVNTQAWAQTPMGHKLQVLPTHGSRGTSSLPSVALLCLVAACGGKISASPGDATGAGGQKPGQGGASHYGVGGQAVSYATGGRPTVYAGTGGILVPSSTGGTTFAFASTGGVISSPPLPISCPGIPITTVAVDAGTPVNADAGVKCVGVGVELEQTPLDMYLMIDRSQSMTTTVQDTTLQRWDVLQQGLLAFLSDPNVIKKAPRVGLGFFGRSGNLNDPAECDPNSYAQPQIEIAPIGASGPELLQAVQAERNLLGGQTPWFPALQGSLMHAQSWQTANPRLTVVVLVTDGLPTECDQYMSDIQEMVGEYSTGVQGTYNTTGQPGIRTYMIGIAVDKFNLDAVAQAGGTGSSTNVDITAAVDEFVTALVNITSANLQCEIPLPSPAPGQIHVDPTKIQLFYKPFQGTSQQIPNAGSTAGCGSPNGGWYFDNPTSPTTITLCPCSCANVGAGSIELDFGCPMPWIIS